MMRSPCCEIMAMHGREPAVFAMNLRHGRASAREARHCPAIHAFSGLVKTGRGYPENSGHDEAEDSGAGYRATAIGGK